MLFTLFLTVHLLGVRLRAFLPHNCVLAFLSPRLGWFRMRHKDAIPLTSRRCLTGPETSHNSQMYQMLLVVPVYGSPYTRRHFYTWHLTPSRELRPAEAGPSSHVCVYI